MIFYLLSILQTILYTWLLKYCISPFSLVLVLISVNFCLNYVSSSRYGGTDLLSQHSRGRGRRNSNNSLVSKARPYLKRENDILSSGHVQIFSFSISSRFILNLSCFLIIFCSIFIFFYRYYLLNLIFSNFSSLLLVSI